MAVSIARRPEYLLHPYELPALVVGVFFIYVYLNRRRARQLSNPRNLPYPPGPKGIPLLGNVLDLPREKESACYWNMAQQYGDLVFMQVLDKTILVVNSYQAATELFDKRGTNYSDRNELPMINDLMGWDWSFGHMRYGERWKTHRQMFHRQFQQSAVSVYQPTQLKEAHKLIRHMLHEPSELTEHLRVNSGSLIMNVVYGIEIADDDDHYISVAEKALEGMAKAAHPGAFLVDIFPSLKYVPEFMAGFKKMAREWKTSVIEMRDAPFYTVNDALKHGKAAPSFTAHLLSDLEMKKDTSTKAKDLETIRNCAGLAYAAGTESMASSLNSFMLAMILYPEVQEKARQELDSVVGQGRLPDFNDRGSLPYIEACVKEVLRWNPVAPLGLPHMATKDDEYNGYLIPAGTTIMGNSWTILHDPRVYPEPSKFMPERFMDAKAGRAPHDHLNVAFGYGRRICPGRFMADAQLWISIACILSAFDILPGMDGNGKYMKTEAAFASGMICHPLPYKYTIKPRSEKAQKLIEQTVDF